MKIKRTQLVPVRFEPICTDCNEGTYVTTGESNGNILLGSHTLKWLNRCNKCGHQKWANEQYPKIGYVDTDKVDIIEV